MRIAMIGTRGVPARYGGFETAVEEIGSRLSDAGHEVLVFCRTPKGQQGIETYKGMKLVHLPVLKKRTMETLAHTALSVINPALRGVDSAVLFNAANAPFLPVLRARRIPVASHVDGLEWRRAKWSGLGQNYYRIAERLAVRWADALIADAQGIADYYQEEFHAPTRLITYGAPVLRNLGSDKLAPLGLDSRGFHLVVARFEKENNVLEIVQGYVESKARLPLVVVGSAPYSTDYTAAIADAGDDRVRLLGGVWDQDQLDQLYAHCLSYLHGHSVGGTNPSLLRAGGAGAFTIAYDVVFNREVIKDTGEYFKVPGDLVRILPEIEANPDEAVSRGGLFQDSMDRYNWDQIAADYETLYKDLSTGNYPRRRPSGKRFHSSTWRR